MKSLLIIGGLFVITPVMSQLSNDGSDRGNSGNNSIRQHPKDTVTVLINDGQQDTITRPLYCFSDDIMERLVDSFLSFEPCGPVYFCCPKQRPSIYVMSSDHLSRKGLNLDSIRGVYKYGKETLLFYGLSDSILSTYWIDRTPDSICIKSDRKSDFVVSCENKYMLLGRKTRDDAHFGILVQGSTYPIDMKTSPWFKWMYKDSSGLRYTGKSIPIED